MVKYLNKWLRFSKSFPFVSVRNRRRPSLIVVEDLYEVCVTDAEKLLYERLRANGYYPNPHYVFKRIKMNLALVPYRLALIETHPGLNEKRIARLLKKQRWHVLFYDSKQLIHNEQKYVNLVLEYAPTQTKNVSTS